MCIRDRGGAYDYLVNGRMLGGFAVIAWPVRWGETGVMTFIVSHNSDVYEKDLGPDTAQAAAAINVFNPGQIVGQGRHDAGSPIAQPEGSSSLDWSM